MLFAITIFVLSVVAFGFMSTEEKRVTGGEDCAQQIKELTYKQTRQQISIPQARARLQYIIDSLHGMFTVIGSPSLLSQTEAKKVAVDIINLHFSTQIPPVNLATDFVLYTAEKSGRYNMQNAKGFADGLFQKTIVLAQAIASRDGMEMEDAYVALFASYFEKAQKSPTGFDEALGILGFIFTTWPQHLHDVVFYLCLQRNDLSDEVLREYQQPAEDLLSRMGRFKGIDF